MRKQAVVVVAMLAVFLLAVAPARAITYAEPDGTGHLNVGPLVIEIDGVKDWTCRGTLISPTVFLTASHCSVSDRIWGTFDADFSAQSKLCPGIFYVNLASDQSQDDTGDIAVVVFDRAVKGIAPAQLSSAWLFDDLNSQNGLKDQIFTAVGYGA